MVLPFSDAHGSPGDKLVVTEVTKVTRWKVTFLQVTARTVCMHAMVPSLPGGSLASDQGFSTQPGRTQLRRLVSGL